ncbi:hypothetical protein RhiirA4_430394 [Rhizophagus irregularis]|uniref:Uncharacterized protein n=1 Tax=Rhizophagus irregularis TaxID=588596 RepID=A0A2I1HKN2_9GLOM|nr:hypothetical protein RhiirA4_430394 [Rhizophagus irregularis]
MVKAQLRFTKIYEDIYKRGGSNISIKINGKDYFFRMFDSKLTLREIKEKNNNPSGQEQIAKASSSTEISSSQKNDKIEEFNKLNETFSERASQRSQKRINRIYRKRYHNFIVWDEGFWYEGSTYYSVNKECGFGVLLAAQPQQMARIARSVILVASENIFRDSFWR